MTSFTSGKRAELGLPPVNSDPWPWLEPDGSRYVTVEAYYTGLPREFAPRPEFDVPENPILAEVRNIQSKPWHERSSRFGRGIYARYLMVANDTTTEDDWTEAEREHARRVLSKLAALS